MNEPRRKQKWAYDPQNKGWSDDKSKYGHRMLEKMGWSDGNGLGKKGNGITSHIKVRTKNNALGVGASNRDVDYAWLDTQDTFNSLLKDLNEACGCADGSIPEGPPPDSVLKDSKKNRKRGARLAMFESRFRKGKDLSMMKADDLACILGGSSKRPERLRAKGETGKQTDTEGTTSSPSSPPVVVQDVSGLTIITHKESVADYFATKMAEKKRKSMGAAAANGVHETETSASSARAGVDESSAAHSEARDGTDATSGATDTSSKRADKKKKKKKEKKSKADRERAGGDGPKRKKGLQDDGDSESDSMARKEKKKLKRKKKSDDGAADVDPSQKRKKKKSKKGSTTTD
eukprot:m.109926 g.109926  ORF g.109926 m.109926 type:complete len:347 (+) comp10702_c0_seq2:78-1118(+)